MQLIHFLTIVISLSCASLEPLPIEWSIENSFLYSAIAVALFSLLCHIGAVSAASQVKQGNIAPVTGAVWFERQILVFQWLSLGVILLCLVGFGLAETLKSIAVVKDSMFLQALVLLSPGIVNWASTLSAEQVYGVRLGYTQTSFFKHCKYVKDAFRTGVGWLVIPVLLLLGIIDLVNCLPVGEAAAMISLAMVLIAVPICLPKILPIMFNTEPMNPDTEQWLSEILVTSGIGKIKSYRWNTGGRVYNAMVAGLIRPFRGLIISDRVLDDLPREQISMVLLHEAAHIRRWHMPLRMVAVMPAWAMATAVTYLAGDGSYAMALGSAAGILSTMLLLRLAAYRTEFDADHFACLLASRLDGKCPGVPQDYWSASEALTKALYRVTASDTAASKSSWLHPSIEQRAQKLQQSNQPHASIGIQ